MRLFSALVPPAAVLSSVADAARIAASGSDLRWTRPEQWHITLGFYARVEERQEPRLRERLATVASRHPPLRLQLIGGGRFDGRVLWLGVDGDMAPLSRLARASVTAAARVGIDVEDRRFRAHLTLARSRAPTDLRPEVAALDGWSSPAWTADTLTLFRSNVGPRPSYEVLGSWPLTAPLRRPQTAHLP